MDIKLSITEAVSDLSRKNLSLKNELEALQKKQENKIDEIFNEFLTVIDTFERGEQIIQEINLDEDTDAKRAINRLLNAKKKVLFILERYDIKKLEFENNRSVEELCEVSDTEPDPTKNDGDIISIEKQGYTRSGHLLRPAEVIIVKN